MLLSRILSFIFRAAEFISAIIVLGLSAFFIHRNRQFGAGPRGRLIFTLVWAIISTLLSLVWLIPTTWSFMHYPLDFIISAGWFAAFAILYRWLHDFNGACGSVFNPWNWGSQTRSQYCDSWRATEAFSIMSGIFWFISFLLSVYVFHRVRGKGARRAHAV